MLVSLCGNIGAGKTTILSILKNSFHTIEENVKQWEHDGMLKKFYNKEITPTEFQSYVYNDFISNIRNNKKKFSIIERSIEEQSVFTTVNNVDLDLVAPNDCSPEYFFYIYAPPEECFRRLQKRKIHGDSSITLDYLKKLHQCEEQFVFETRQKGKLVLEFDTMKNTPEQIAKKIKNLFKAKPQ